MEKKNNFDRFLIDPQVVWIINMFKKLKVYRPKQNENGIEYLDFIKYKYRRNDNNDIEWNGTIKDCLFFLYIRLRTYDNKLKYEELSESKKNQMIQESDLLRICISILEYMDFLNMTKEDPNYEREKKRFDILFINHEAERPKDFPELIDIYRFIYFDLQYMTVKEYDELLKSARNNFMEANIVHKGRPVFAKKIYVYDKSGKELLYEFNSRQECMDKLGIKQSRLSQVLGKNVIGKYWHNMKFIEN